MNLKQTLSLSTLALVTGCTSTGQQTTTPPLISYEQASAFERTLLSRAANPSQAIPLLYTQPVNKKEACQLPTTQDQLDRPHFRAYWDGECKNGFAYGLGRDIALSDTHHIEEITVHDGTGQTTQKARVSYDYVNNTVVYGISGQHFPEDIQFQEHMADAVGGFNVYRTLSVVDASGKAFVIQTAAFDPKRISLNTRVDGSIAYKFTDNSALPPLNPNDIVFSVDTLDPKSNTLGGVAVARYGNGAVQPFLVSNNHYTPVILPDDYANHLSSLYHEIITNTSQAGSALQQAQQLEREYLFKACQGKGSVAGLDNETYSKICTWRDTFKARYANASNSYQQALENRQQQVANAEQQRQLQQQIALQQQMLQQQKNQQGWDSINQASQQIMKNSQTLMQNSGGWQAPQVQPIMPPGGNKVICYSTGNLTTCR